MTVPAAPTRLLQPGNRLMHNLPSSRTVHFQKSWDFKPRQQSIGIEIDGPRGVFHTSMREESGDRQLLPARPIRLLRQARSACRALLLIGTETGRLSAVGPQVLQFLGVEAIRNPAKVHDTETGLRKKVAFTKNLNAPVPIEGELATDNGHHPEALLRSTVGAQLMLKPPNSSIDGFHSRFFQN